MERFKNKYRIPSARLKHWDYGAPALYFITICTKEREQYFGEIENGKMNLNEIGRNANEEWLKTAELRKDMNLYFDAFVVMPNHFHAIIGIGDNEYNSSSGRDAMHGVSTGKIFGPQQKNLASIVRGFKSAITTFALKNDLPFKWQERFHDHIIRDEKEYNLIRNYIVENPMSWGKDKFFIEKETST